jgi:hypothetical protein
LSAYFRQSLEDLASLRRRALAFALHLRETNLAMIVRLRMDRGLPCPASLVQELEQILADDVANCREEKDWPEAQTALDLLHRDVNAFLRTHLREEPDRRSKGAFSVTSR